MNRDLATRTRDVLAPLGGVTPEPRPRSQFAVPTASHRQWKQDEITALVTDVHAAMQGQAFAYRNEIRLFASAFLKARLGRALRASEYAKVAIVAIELWPPYARARGIDVRTLESHHQYPPVEAGL